MAANRLIPLMIGMAVLFVTHGVAGLHAQLRDREVSPREALTTALRELTQEAREAKKNCELPRLNADFAAQYSHDIDDALIASRLTKPADRDPFVDAYVRWQLTGFLDELPAMDDRTFEEFLSELPPCVPNPQTSKRVVQPLMQASSVGTLAPSDLKHVEKLIEELRAQREQASVLRRPADELRAWVAEQVGEDGHRPLQVSIEHCAALARTGWDVRGAKEKITRQCEAALRDRSFTEEQRQRIAKQLESLAQFSTLRITDAYVRDGSLIVSTDSVGVYDFEVRKWARTILRQ